MYVEIQNKQTNKVILESCLSTYQWEAFLFYFFNFFLVKTQFCIVKHKLRNVWFSYVTSKKS